MNTVGVSCPGFCTVPPEEMLDRISAEFRHWEIFSELDHEIQRLGDDFWDKADATGMTFSLHTSIADTDLAALNPRMREASVMEFLSSMECAKAVGIDTVTIHPGLISLSVPGTRDRSIRAAKESCRVIDKAARSFGIGHVCIENMPNVPVMIGQTASELAEIIDGTDLEVTFDIGHAFTAGQTDAMLDMFDGRIGNIHIHDNNGLKDEHLTIGEGKIDFPGIIGRLGGYKGRYIIESKSLESAVCSRDRLSKMLRSVSAPCAFGVQLRRGHRRQVPEPRFLVDQVFDGEQEDYDAYHYECDLHDTRTGVPEDVPYHGSHIEYRMCQYTGVKSVFREDVSEHQAEYGGLRDLAEVPSAHMRHTEQDRGHDYHDPSCLRLAEPSQQIFSAVLLVLDPGDYRHGYAYEEHAENEFLERTGQHEFRRKYLLRHLVHESAAHVRSEEGYYQNVDQREHPHQRQSPGDRGESGARTAGKVEIAVVRFPASEQTFYGICQAGTYDHGGYDAEYRIGPVFAVEESAESEEYVSRGNHVCEYHKGYRGIYHGYEGGMGADPVGRPRYGSFRVCCVLFHNVRSTGTDGYIAIGLRIAAELRHRRRVRIL